MVQVAKMSSRLQHFFCPLGRFAIRRFSCAPQWQTFAPPTYTNKQPFFIPPLLLVCLAPAKVDKRDATVLIYCQFVTSMKLWSEIGAMIIFHKNGYITDKVRRTGRLWSNLHGRELFYNIARENAKLTTACRAKLYNPEIKGVLYPGTRKALGGL